MIIGHTAIILPYVLNFFIKTVHVLSPNFLPILISHSVYPIFSESLNTFTIIIFNSLLSRLLISTSGVLSYSFIRNIFFCCLFYLILCFFSLYLVGLLHFLTLKIWPFVGDLRLCVPAVHSPQITRALCSRGVPYWAI